MIVFRDRKIIWEIYVLRLMKATKPTDDIWPSKRPVSIIYTIDSCVET